MGSLLGKKREGLKDKPPRNFEGEEGLDYDETDGPEEADVLIFFKHKEPDEINLADKLRAKLTDNHTSCVIGSSEYKLNSTVDIAYETAKVVVHLIGSKFVKDQYCDVLTGAQQLLIGCKVSKEDLAKNSEDFPSQCFRKVKPSDWFIIEEDVTKTVDKLTDKVMEYVKQSVKHDGDDDGKIQRLIFVINSALPEVADYLSDEGKNIITTTMLCEDLMPICKRWEGFTTKTWTFLRTPTNNEFCDKHICNFIMGIDDVINYCYLTVLKALLFEQAEKLTKDSLVEILVLTGHPYLAKSVYKDPNFTPTMTYLSMKLWPLRYEYHEYGSLLGLDLPNFSYITELEENSSLHALRFVVVIIQWLQRHKGNAPTKELLKKVLEAKNEKQLAEKLMQKYEDFSFPKYKQTS